MPERTDDGGTPFELVLDPVEPGHVHVRLWGELDAEASRVLWRALDDLPPLRAATVDAGRLAFVDSAGLGCLYKLHQLVVDGGGIVAVVGASPSFRRLLEMTGLHRLLAVVPSA